MCFNVVDLLNFFHLFVYIAINLQEGQNKNTKKLFLNSTGAVSVCCFVFTTNRIKDKRRHRDVTHWLVKSSSEALSWAFSAYSE